MSRKNDPRDAEKQKAYMEKMRAWDARDEENQQGPTKDNFLSAWTASVARFRATHFGYRPRPFLFPEEKARKAPVSLWSNNLFRIPLAGSFALAAVLLVIFLFPNPNPQVPSETGKALTAGNFPRIGGSLFPGKSLISLGDKRTLRVTRGALVVVDAQPGAVPTLDLMGNVVQGDFDLRGKTNLIVRNAYIRVVVTGTAFGIDWAGETGKVTLRRGSVTVEHNNGQQLRLKPGAELKYTKEGMRIASAGPPALAPPDNRFIFNMKSGEILKGVLLRENAEKITVLNDEGKTVVLQKSEIDDRIRESAIVKKDQDHEE